MIIKNINDIFNKEITLDFYTLKIYNITTNLNY